MKFKSLQTDLSIVAAIAIVVAALFVIIAQFSAATYNSLTEESTGIELATAILYLVGGVLLLVHSLRNWTNVAAAALTVLLAAFFIFIAGEEESWGMWILGFKAPEAVANVNIQNEINIHNLDLFAGLLEPHRILNLFIFLYMILVPILNAKVIWFHSLFKKIYLPVSDLRWIPWFIVALAYDRLARSLVDNPGVELWRHTEVAEFLYSVGLIVFVMAYIKSRQNPAG